MTVIPTDSAAAIAAALKAFRAEIGSNADVNVSLSPYCTDAPIYASVYPDGMSKERAFSLNLREWSEIIPALRAKWSDFAIEHQARTIRAMALEIIKITAEQGECSDAALRLKFTAEDVERLGAEACADADRIASNGPFTIARLAGANAA